MYKLFFIYLLSIFLLEINSKSSIFYRRKKTPKIYLTEQQRLQKLHRDKKTSSFHLALITGKKIKFKRKLKKDIKKLGIIHWLTPSGIHLSSAFLYFFIFFKFLKRKNKFIYKILFNSILLSLYFSLPDFYSLQRVILFKFFKQFKFLRKMEYAFIATFLFDYLFGNYQNSPLSFTFSFLFFGIIVSEITRTPYPKLTLPLLGGQIIIASYFDYEINFLASIIGIYLTGIFSALFPVFFLDYFLSKLTDYSFSTTILKALIFAIEKAATISETYFISFIPNKEFVPALVLTGTVVLVLKQFHQFRINIFNLWENKIFRGWTIRNVRIFRSNS